MQCQKKDSTNRQKTDHHYADMMLDHMYQKFHWFHAMVILIFITLAMFGDVIFSSNGLVLSKQGTDTYSLFMYWRDFGFNQIKQGNLPLWNPHLFSGAPFFGGFHSALLYPLNWIYLILPISTAINSSISMHVFLIGFFMYLWTSYRGLHPLACLLSSVLLMFSGANFMHIYAGHLIDISTMAWAPLLFLIIDRLLTKPSISLYLVGVFAVSMQILGGHPQYMYYTAIAVAIYSGLLLIKCNHRLTFLFSIAIIYIGGTAVSAVQVLSGIEAASEGVRSGGTTYEFASMFSFPPENFITLFCPFFFGDITTVPYWGRAYLWAMTPFISITGLALALYGTVYGEKKTRRFSLTMYLILMILALGSHTPLFSVLYHYVPGFNMFRGNSKFIFLASIFLIMLASIGLDNLIRQTHPVKKISAVVLVTSIILGIIASLLYISPTVPYLAEIWRQTMQAVEATYESYLPSQIYQDSDFIQKAAHFASINLFIATGVCLLLSSLFFLSYHSKKTVFLIVIIACVEIFTFVKFSISTFDLKSLLIPDLVKFCADRPGDYRILNLINPNSAMITNAKDIWGYDPGVQLRYAQFIAFTQGHDPDKVTQYMSFTHHHRLFSMLRCQYAFVPDKDRINIHEFKDVMPRLHLIQDWKLITDRNAIFSEMNKESFDPRKTVILEKQAYPEPVISENTGYSEIADYSTDHITIKATLSNPAILLITDSYSTGWQAKALPDSVQNTYNILPANYILMAIPLSAGEHLFRVEYIPLSFRIGKWISLVSLAIYFALLFIFWHKSRQKILHRG